MRYVFPKEIEYICHILCSDMYPFETGGLFLGLVQGDRTEITKIIGAGPSAIHRRYSFEPDHQWQNKEIANYYEETGRRAIIVGDWHSHPDALTAKPSRQDQKVAKKLIKSAEFRNSEPIIAIFYGSQESWDHSAWVVSLNDPNFFGFQNVVFDSVEFELEDTPVRYRDENPQP